MNKKEKEELTDRLLLLCEHIIEQSKLIAKLEETINQHTIALKRLEYNASSPPTLPYVVTS